jgi:hypothetical protein
MDVKDYLNTVYYLDGASGADLKLWEKQTPSDNYTLNGYFQRIKKINDTIIPINEEIVRLNNDLVKKKASLEVATATQEASVSGI